MSFAPFTENLSKPIDRIYALGTKIVLLAVETCTRIWKTEEILKQPRTFTARIGDSENSQDTDSHSAEGRPDDEEFDGHTDLTRVLTDIGEIMPPWFDSCLFTTW